MKVQARGLLRSFYSDGSAGRWARKRAAKSVPWGGWGREEEEEEGRGVVRSGAVQEALIHPRVMPLTVKEEKIYNDRVFSTPLYLFFPPLNLLHLSSLSLRMCICVRIEGNVDNEKG